MPNKRINDKIACVQCLFIWDLLKPVLNTFDHIRKILSPLKSLDQLLPCLFLYIISSSKSYFEFGKQGMKT